MCIRDSVDSSASTLKRGSQLNRVSAISSNLSGKVVDSGFSCCETFISRMVEQLICCDVVTVYVFYLFILCPVDPGDFVVYKDETRTKWEVRYQLVARIHTHAHTRARAHTYTHTHTHTNNSYLTQSEQHEPCKGNCWLLGLATKVLISKLPATGGVWVIIE